MQVKMFIESESSFVEQITSLFDLHESFGSLYCFDQVTSTMDVAKSLAANSLNLQPQKISLPQVHPELKHSFILAREQTSGRGREKRTWISTRDSGVYLSYLISGNFLLPQTMGLSLAVGVCILRALEHLSVFPRLKWPNDVLIQGDFNENYYKFPYFRKLAGTLIETFSVGQDKHVCIGVGLNVFRQEANLPIISIEEVIDIKPNYFEIVKYLIIELANGIKSFWENSLISFKTEWDQASMLNGLQIGIKQQNNEIVGICQGIDLDGSLVVRSNNEIRKIYSGDLELL